MKWLLIVCLLLLVGGCSLAIVKGSNMFFLRHDVTEQFTQQDRAAHHIGNLPSNRRQVR